jgi:hypothetical protein
MNARIIVHGLALALAGVLSYGAALLLLSSCGGVQSSLSGAVDSGPTHKPHDAAQALDAPPSADAVPPAREGGARETSTPDAPPSLHVPPEGGKPDGGARETDGGDPCPGCHEGPSDASCTGWNDAGYLTIDGSSGFRFSWEWDAAGLAVEGGAPCSGFGCWFQCGDSGPCPQSSNCPEGLVCIVSRDASLANPDDYRGTCERLNP